MRWRLPTLAAVLWVIALTVVSVLLGLRLIGPYGSLIGAVPLALGSVLAAYVPVISESAHRRRTELADLNKQRTSAQTRWDAIAEPHMEIIGSGPASLLRADREIVEFTGRDTELAALRAWYTSARARSVRTIVGSGGVGKTRLALKLAAEWESLGGDWRRVDSGQEAVAVATARMLTADPILLVVDYAETRTDLDAMLRAVLEDPGRIRVLFVARALGEWWDRLIEKSPPAIGDLLTEGKPILLGAEITHEFSDVDLATKAVSQFARALKCAVPERVEFELSSNRMPVLVLHAAALVTVLRSQDNSAAPLRVVVAEGALDELLIHEARYWRRTAAMVGLPEDGAQLKAVVAIAALLGSADSAEAAAMVARVPDLANAPLAQRRLWARWLYSLYPADTEGQLGSLQPDLLAEAHVVMQLADDSDLAAACLRELPMPQAIHALTVLARAWAHQDRARKLLVDALNADLAHLALPAAMVTLQTNSALGEHLAAALRDAPVPEDVLIEIAHLLPYPSIVLGEALLAASWRVRRSLSSEANPTTIAEWSNLVAKMLYRAGRPADSLPMAEEAVSIYRELAAANPVIQGERADLANALTSLGNNLIMLGRVDAIPPLKESVAIFRELAADDRHRYLPDLADSLHNLGFGFAELARPADALPVELEAANILRELAAVDSSRYGYRLADSFNNLGNRFSELGRPAQALSVAELAVAIRRRLASANPDRYQSELAQSLSNLCGRLSELGRPADALPVIEESVAIYRELAKFGRDNYRPDLAQALNNLGATLHMLGQPLQALGSEEEAVAIRRELAAIIPDRYRPDLAQSLYNLGMAFSELGRLAEALDAEQEAVSIYRQLVANSPGRRPDLARALEGLAEIHLALEQPVEALAAEGEVIAIRRELAAIIPDRYRPDLAHSLHNLSIILSELGRLAEALDAEQEAVSIYRQLVANSPGRRPDLARALEGLAEIHAALGQPDEAERIRNETRELREASIEPWQLPEDSSVAVAIDYADPALLVISTSRRALRLPSAFAVAGSPSGRR